MVSEKAPLSLGHRADLERLTTLVVMGTGQKRSLQMDVFPANERQSKRQPTLM